MLQKATIETNEDCNNVLDYLEELLDQGRGDVVRLNNPFIYTDEYEIKVGEDYLDLFDELEGEFVTVEPQELIPFDIPPIRSMIVQDFKFDIY